MPAMPERPYCPHLCFETDDMDAVLETLEKEGIPILDGRMKSPDPSGGCIYGSGPECAGIHCLAGQGKIRQALSYSFLCRGGPGGDAAAGRIARSGTPPRLCAFL